MSIVDEVSTQLKEAMKAREKLRLSALRSIRALLLNEMKKDNSEDLDDEVSITLLRRLEKQRGESIEAFETAGRTEQVEGEKAEREIIRSFLPQLADEDSTRKIVEAAIDATGASNPKEMGRVMGAVMKEHKGKVDGTLVKRIASELLTE
jgi:uncharacterized protein YqeY